MKTIGRLMPVISILAILFITLGDKVLPQPLAGISFNTRNNINNFLLSAFPDTERKNPYQKSDEALKQAEEYQRNHGIK